MFGFEEIVYADDFNASKSFAMSTSNISIRQVIDECQEALHDWGRANGVIFDVGKEHKVILNHVEPEGDSFTLLGVSFDPKLIMAASIHDCAVQAS